MRKGISVLFYGILGLVVLVFIVIGCVIEANAFVSLNRLFADTKSFENGQTISFAEIETVQMNVNDASISIVESDVDEVTLTSTVENRGTGYIVQPKAWIEDHTLYFEQGFVIGYGTDSIGEITLEVPTHLELDYDISNGSGDVLFEAGTAKDLHFDMAVGALNVYALCETFTASTVSGDINIYGEAENVVLDTVSGDVSLLANATTNEIDFESVSGDCKVFAQELGGYYLYHQYAGGNRDDYFELSSNQDNTISITADTVDGSVEVFDRATLAYGCEFFEEDV